MVLNYVSEGHPYNANVYAWDDRQLELWRAFLRRYALRVAVDLPCDVPNGGFCLWRMVTRAPPAREPLFYLPGIKPLRHWIREPYLETGDDRAAAARAMTLSARFPDVLVFKAEAGLFLAGAGEWARGYPLLRECADRGMVGEALHTYLGTAAMHLGRFDEALRRLEVAERLYPDQRVDLERRIGEVLARQARDAVRAGRRERALALALEAARRAPASAFALVTLADVRMARGESAEALALYLRVASLGEAPDAVRRHADEMIARCRATPSGAPGTSPR
jgi:tetratricopeptide (TPR) repeat protein